MSQVFHNLMINADQAMPDGGIVRIRIENEKRVSGDAEKAFLKVTISDQGVGIDPDNIGRIFDPYYTIKVDGSGLGLPIAYTIVKHHGGTLRVRSTPGKGTMFEFELPARPDAVVRSGLRGENLPRGKGRVLVMDDEDRVRDVAKTMLEQLGYEADCAAGGEEAIDAYERVRGRRVQWIFGRSVNGQLP
jgi:hypothetical protein